MVDRIPILSIHINAHQSEEGQTTLHHRDSLWVRYHVMEHHYGRLQTILLHVWFALRSVFK